MNLFKQTKFTRYLEIDFGSVNRGEFNPYRIMKEIKEITGQKPKELTGSSKTKITLQTRTAEQTLKCLEISSLAGKICKITPHWKFNTSKGLIFLKQFEIEDTEEFKINLREQYDVINVERASFIRTKQGITPYIITFKQETTPYTLFIPGETSDTVVNQFIPRPMMCAKCLEYGHTQKRCKKIEHRCKICADTGHSDSDCTSETTKCHHCLEDHKAGSKDCVRQIQEQKILDSVESEKVTFQRARQILTERPVIRSATESPPTFPTLFYIKFPSGTKRKMNPWLVEKTVMHHTGKMPRKCLGKPNEEDTFVVEVGSEHESRSMSTITKIGAHDVEILVNDTCNLQKGLIFVEGYDLTDFDGYREELMKQHNLRNVEQAHWIKTRNPPPVGWGKKKNRPTASQRVVRGN